MSAGQGLREALHDLFHDVWHVDQPTNMATSVLALPEMAALIADAERVRRVRELVQDGEAQEAQTAAEGDPLTVMVRVRTLRRALDGTQP